MSSRFPVLLTTALCLLALTAAPANATTSVTINAQDIAIASADGQPMQLTISIGSHDFGAGSEHAITITDLTGPITSSNGPGTVDAGQPCPVGDTPNTVHCRLKLTGEFSYRDSVNGTITGGAGNDTITIAQGNWMEMTIDGSGGDDVIDVTHSILYGGVNGGDGNDTIYPCSCGESTVHNPPDGYVFAGGAGVDTVSFERATTAIDEFWSNNYNIGTDVERYIGSAFADTLWAPNATFIAVGAGNDRVSAPKANATVLLGEGDDTFSDDEGKAFGQRVSGGAGRDRITTFLDTGARFICLDDRSAICPAFDGRPNERDAFGSDIEDVDLNTVDDAVSLVGSSKDNVLIGGSDNDVFVASGGRDTYRGGPGFDIVTWELFRLPVHLSLDGVRNDGVPAALVERSVEMLGGSPFADVMTGSAGNDGLFGAAGNDVMTGGRGRDYFDGGLGNDVINARDGVADELHCGRGTDTVVADRRDTIARDCERRSVR